MGDAALDDASSKSKKKVTEFVHWERPKSQLYEYNYDYGSYYYRPMIDYINQKRSGGIAPAPKPQFWEERALKSYMDRNSKRALLSSRLSKDELLLKSIRNSSHHYVIHSKAYAQKITGLGF